MLFGSEPLPVNTAISSAIAELQGNWHSLDNFDRALAVRPIIQAGVSRRQLAIAMAVVEGTIRNLLLILEGDPVDLESFLQGEISQNELIRHIRGVQPAREETEVARHPPAPEPKAEPEPRPEPRRIMKPPVGWKPIPFYVPLHRRT